jgi:hypothetical protein
VSDEVIAYCSIGTAVKKAIKPARTFIKNVQPIRCAYPQPFVVIFRYGRYPIVTNGVLISKDRPVYFEVVPIVLVQSIDRPYPEEALLVLK